MACVQLEGGRHLHHSTHKNTYRIPNLKNGTLPDGADKEKGNGNEDTKDKRLEEDPKDEQLIEDLKDEPLIEDPKDEQVEKDPKDEQLTEDPKDEPLGEDNTEEQSNEELANTHDSRQEVLCAEILVMNDISFISQQDVINTHSSQHEAIVTEVEIEEQLSATSMKNEIVRSMLYGGLTELIASLSIVTSSASTGASTGKIVALSLSNLIIGLFVMSYRISKHWINDRESGPDEPREEEVDKYEQVFGDRQNYRLHLTVAILSFVIFGLVPPLLYGFTFRKLEDKYLKIPTVTLVSALCIGLLGTGKAYIEKPENCLVYVNIIGGCIVDAIGTSALTTLGGELIQNYIDQAGWFDFEPNKVTSLLLPGMDFHNQTWRSV